VLSDRYNPTSYRQAIARACKAAGLAKPWTPYQLRHWGATKAAEVASIEVAQAMLGHSSIETTRGYIKVNERRAAAAAKKFA